MKFEIDFWQCSVAMQDAAAQAQSEWRFSFQICVFPLDVSDLSDWGQQGIVPNPAALIAKPCQQCRGGGCCAEETLPREISRTPSRLTEEVILEK